MLLRTFLVIIALADIISTTAQVGVQAFHSVTYSSGFENGEQGSIFEDETIIGIDYWWRLRDLRVEFLPTLLYGFSNKTVTSAEQSTRITLNTWSVQLKSNIYFLDFFNDCKCPTFSKKNDLLKKGLHAQIGVGYTMVTFDPTYTPDLNLLVGLVGFGMDIGISNVFTLTPYVLVDHAISLDEAPVSYPVFSKNDGNRGKIMMGVRVGFRWDRKNFY